MSLCPSIDTLSMAYLDDELAGEERRELELHLVECASCRGHLEAERTELNMLRSALAPPPAPDLLRAKISRALDQQDRRDAHEGRQRWTRWMLPGSAITASAAALLLFLGVAIRPPRAPMSTPVASEAVGTKTRSTPPLEVQGASTESWVRQHFAAVEPPQFIEPNVQLIGGRAAPIKGHDAVELRYLASVGDNRVELRVHLISDIGPNDLSAGQPVRYGQLTLHVHDIGGIPAVSYVDADHIGYLFSSPRLSSGELLELVTGSDLIRRAQQQIR
ncbi:MAG: anti-sigma factor [Kofleriaceae bacterium]